MEAIEVIREALKSYAEITPSDDSISYEFKLLNEHIEIYQDKFGINVEGMMGSRDVKKVVAALRNAGFKAS